MAKVKTLEEFVSEMDRAEEIQNDVIIQGEPEEKTKEEAEAEAEIAQTGDELAEAAFYRLPKDVIATELFVANRAMQSLYSGASAGNDISPKEIEFIMDNLKQVKSLLKKFNKADEVIGTVYEADDVTPIQAKGDGTNPIIPVSEMLEKCYERAIEEAKEWADDAHDDHTVETYMAENAALVAKMGVTALSRLKEEMSTEAFEACLNKMAESYTKKINESKEVKAAEDAEDID
jgi:hypothetical protein